MIEELTKYFKETSEEQILKDWEDTNKYDSVGIPALKFLKINDFLFTKIDDSELSIRTKNICKENEFIYFKDLVYYSQTELIKFFHFGKKSSKEIMDLLISKGFGF